MLYHIEKYTGREQRPSVDAPSHFWTHAYAMKDSYFEEANDELALAFFHRRTARSRSVPLRLRSLSGVGYAVSVKIITSIRCQES